VNDLSFAEMVYVPRRSWEWENSLLLGRVRLNWNHTDLGFIGGKKERNIIAPAVISLKLGEGHHFNNVNA